MRVSIWRLTALLVALVLPCGAASGGFDPSITGTVPLTNLDPTLVPSANYVYTPESVGATVNFSNVTNLQILPALANGSNNYLYTLGVDYSGSVNLLSDAGSITFNHAGPYIVLATNADGSQTYSAYGVNFQIFPAVAGPTYNWHQTPVPAANNYVIDPALAASQPTFPNGSTVRNNIATWNGVLAYLMTLTNANVELSGHGAPGQFYYAGADVLDSTSLAQLNQLKGHVSCLTFMSCTTAQGAAGSSFLQSVANILGTSGGYTDCVGGDGTTWYVNDAGTEVMYTAVPEPSSIVLTGMAGTMILVVARSRRRSVAA